MFNPNIAKASPLNTQSAITLLESYPITNLFSTIDLLSELYPHLSDEEKEKIYQIMLNKTSYTSTNQIENDIKGYRYFSNIFSQYNQYAKKYTLQEINEQFNENMTPYLLAHYIKYYKFKKESYFTSTHLKEITLAYLENHQEILLQKLKELIDIKENVASEAIEKKIKKVVQKAIQKLEKIKNNPDLPINEIEHQINQLKKETLTRLSQYEIIDDSLLQDFLFKCDDPLEKAPTIQEEIKEIPSLNIDFIENLFNQHHLYFKKSQIQDEINHTPVLYQFYVDYSNTTNKDDLNYLLSKVLDAGKKNTESGRKLITMIQKDLESFLENEVVEIKEEPKPNNDLGPTMQLCRHTVYKNSGKREPIDLNQLKKYLHIDSQHQTHYLERLVFEIGYDKVQDYLTKSNHIYIEDLDSIIRTDRKLRFEFQRILEDIEMYFRSSLTYYLTNKYDKVYVSVDNKDIHKRGYLQKNLFIDENLHTQHINQLQERITHEISKNNQQIKKEYNLYKHNLPFSTAAGIMTFGWMVSFFENLNYNDRIHYLSTYYHQISPQTFMSWMNNLAELRNRCAHYHSLYRLNTLRSINTNHHDGNAFDDDFSHHTLFYYTIVMSRLSPDAYNIEDFIDNLGVIFRKASRDNYAFDLFKDYSFPKTWRQILENEKNSKVNIPND